MYLNGEGCAGANVSACNKADSSASSTGPLTSDEYAIQVDLDNLSDVTAVEDTNTLVREAQEAVGEAEAGNSQAAADAWATASIAYTDLLTRCGQLIRGQ